MNNPKLTFLSISTSRLRLGLLMMILLSSVVADAQTYLLSGYVYDDEMTPLQNAEVSFKERALPAKTDQNGYYEIQLAPGRYEAYVTSEGYLSYKSVILVDKSDVQKNFILRLNYKEIEEATVSAKKKDISKRIIKNVIDEKKKNAIIQYSYDAYVVSRSVEDSTRVKKLLERNNPTTDSADVVDSKKVKKTRQQKEEEKKRAKEIENETPEQKLAREEKARKDSINQYILKRSIGEVALHVDRAHPDKISEKREAVKITGDKQQLFYLSATEGEFDFMNSLMYERTLGETPFLSPFSSNGLIMYRYEMMEITNDGFGLVYHISFKPNSIANNLLTGEVWISDKTWKVLKIQAEFPDHLTPAFKNFKLSAEYDEIEYGMYLPTEFIFEYQKIEFPDYEGLTTVKFENYSMDSVVDRKKFSSMQSQTLKEAYEQDSTFWTKNRVIPLSDEDIVYIQKQDSLKAFLKSDHYRDSIDADANKVTLLNILWHGQYYQDWRKDERWYFPSLPEFLDPLSPGGLRIAPAVSYYKRFENKKAFRIFPRVSYGTLNRDWMYNISSYALLDPIRRTEISGQVGKSMNNIFWNDAFINVFSRKNFYLRNSFQIDGQTELINGLELGADFQWAHRQSISDYKFYNIWDRMLYPDSNIVITPVYFEPYNATVATLRLEYTPQRKYILEPYEKIILGSKWPTFYLWYKKGLNGLFKSVVDFDYIETGLRQTVNFGSIGISQYNLKYGNFLKENNVEIIDHKRIARGNPGLFFNPLESFQSVDSTFSLFRGFVEGHYRHDFGGFLISKIPYGRMLKMNEVAGLSVLHAPERNLEYVEFYVGLEKILTVFKTRFKVGVFGVKAFNNKFPSPPEIKFGLSFWDSYNNKWN